MKMQTLLGAMALACSTLVQAAGIEGDTVSFVYYYPNAATVYYDDGSRVVTSGGVEFVDSPFEEYVETSINVSPNQVIFDFPNGTRNSTSGYFGYVFTNLTHVFPAAYQLIASDIVALPAGGFYSTVGNTFTVKLTGLEAAEGGSMTFALVNSPVPEPETYAMLLAGLGLMGAVARRRKLKGLPNPRRALKTH